MSGKVVKITSDGDKHEGDVTYVTYALDNVYSGGYDGRIKIWDKDLNHQRTYKYHSSYVYALAVAPTGKLYSSAYDGAIKLLEKPLDEEIQRPRDILRGEDDIECLQWYGDALYSGDDKGVVVKFQNDKVQMKYNLCEEVKSLAIEGNRFYSIRENDAVVSELTASESEKYTTKAAIPGRAPLALCGPVAGDRKSYLAFATRDGKGLVLASNKAKENYAVKWTKEDCHEMIITTICGSDKSLFTAGWDGKLKKWTNIDSSPQLAGEFDVGSCINSVCLGPDETVYTASSDGKVRKIIFN